MTLKTILDFRTKKQNHYIMKNKLNLLIVSLFITCGLFIYLTIHHYAIQRGLDGPTLCSINEKLNCDAAASSQYSEVFGIPIAVLGLCFNFVMLVYALMSKLSWVDENKNTHFAIKAGFILASLICVSLAFISVLSIKVVCTFCLATYVFTFINTYLAWSIFTPAVFNISELFSQKGTIGMFISIPILAWFVSGVIQDNYGLDEIKKMSSEKILQWQSSPTYNFGDVGLVQNQSGTKATLIEFADFKCPHCKTASTTLHNFIKGHNDIKFIYKPFPLDGVCNPEINQKGDGSRCKMAAWALCSEKLSQKGWQVHKWYFDNQERLFQVSDLKEENRNIAKEFSLDYDAIESCSESVETYDLIKTSALEAKAAGVEGTPTIYLNNKKLPMGQFVEILRSALKTIKN